MQLTHHQKISLGGKTQALVAIDFSMILYSFTRTEYLVADFSEEGLVFVDTVRRAGVYGHREKGWCLWTPWVTHFEVTRIVRLASLEIINF